MFGAGYDKICHEISKDNMASDYRKIVQAVAYLAQKSGAEGLNRLHAFKLLYLADRDHLRRCGSLITGDSYNAMKFGPLPVAAERLLKSKRAPEAERGYADQYLRMESTGRTSAMIHCKAVDSDQLSKQEIDSLDLAWSVYQRTPDIVEYTHEFPEWKRADKKRVAGVAAVPMKIEDFFLAAPKDVEYCAADPEWVSSSKELYGESTWVDAL